MKVVKNLLPVFLILILFGCKDCDDLKKENKSLKTQLNNAWNALESMQDQRDDYTLRYNNCVEQLSNIDSNAICKLCMSNFIVRAEEIWDSVRAVRYEQIALRSEEDSIKISILKQEALDEVTEYREASIFQVDTMRGNFLTFRAHWLDVLDSLKRSKIYDNMIIRGDTIANSEARFDSITGKPYLILK